MSAGDGGGGARRGIVRLVGAGPGDPDLITVRGLRYLQSAEAVVYDALVDGALLALARREARKLHVGKRAGCHCMPQEDINALLIALAGEGLEVVRLKGGDPFVFGRGGEEVLALAAADVPFEIVPGVSAGTAAAAAALIPVTHRAVARSVTFFTAHAATEGDEVDYRALAGVGGTLVAFMGLSRLDQVARSLIAGGLAPDLPAAVIAEATTPRERVVTSTASLISECAARAGLSAPALVVFGDVVRFPTWLRDVQGLARASPTQAR